MALMERRQRISVLIKGRDERGKRAHLRVSEEGRHGDVEVQNVRDNDVPLVDVVRDVGRVRCRYGPRLGGREGEGEGKRRVVGGRGRNGVRRSRGGSERFCLIAEGICLF